MAYTINLTNGSILTTVSDGTSDRTTTSLVLTGRNYKGYGEDVAENFVTLLENSAHTAEPANPLVGQLWFDLNENKLNLYTGTSFKTINTTASESAEPTAPEVGELWFDTVNEQLSIYNGATYTLVGPLYSSVSGVSGPTVETLLDAGSNEHIVTVTRSGGAIISISSKDIAFAPVPVLPGFANINPGIQLSTDISGVVPEFIGDATNALSLGGEPATSYLSSVNNDTTSGTLSILNDGGLIVGFGSDVKISVTGNDAYIAKETADGRLVIQSRPGGILKDVITIVTDGAEARARVSAPGSNGLDIVNKTYADTADNALGILVTNLDNDKLDRDGSQAMTGTLNMGNFAITNILDPTGGTNGFDRDYGDNRYVTQDITSAVNQSGGAIELQVYNKSGDSLSALQSGGLKLGQPANGADTFIAFEGAIAGDGFNLGRDGATSDLYVGGGDFGGTQHRVWHAGNDGPGSGLNADFLDGLSSTSFLTTSDNYKRSSVNSAVFLYQKALAAGEHDWTNNTLSYTSKPSWANYVLLRFSWELWSASLHDLRWGVAKLGGYVVAGCGADDTDQGNVSQPFVVSEVWVPTWATTLEQTWKYGGKSGGTFYLKVHRLGWHE